MEWSLGLKRAQRLAGSVLSGRRSVVTATECIWLAARHVRFSNRNPFLLIAFSQEYSNGQRLKNHQAPFQTLPPATASPS